MKDLRLSLDWIIENIGVRMVGSGLAELSSQMVSGISTDSRTVSPGEVFVALAGERFDGHAHAAEAVKRGALAVVAHKTLRGEAGRLAIKVPDTLEALGHLANSLRRRQGLKVVALTGSNGKTTTKELLAAILKKKDPFILFTKGNLNNHVGLPLTMFQVRKKSRLAILEMGANHFGEIAYLTSIAEPDVALITSIGAAHLEFFGSLSKVAQAKGELYAGLNTSAVAVVDADEPLLTRQAKAFRGNKLFYGIGPEAQVRLGRIRARGLQGQELLLSGPGAAKGLKVNLRLLGAHNAHNALAAAAAALAAGADWGQIKAGLEEAESYPGRLHAVKAASGLWILDDSYNANPTSMAAGLKVLAESGYKGPRGAILGDMGELGSKEKAFHRDLGRLTAELNLDFLAFVGPLSSLAAAAARRNGFDKSAVAEFDDAEDAARWVHETRPGQSAVLVKGSRFMKLEKAVSYLQNI